MRKKSQKQKQPQNTTEPICETVNLLLTESKNSDNDTRVLLILQTKSFFQELLATATIDGDNTSLVNSAHLLFRVINESMQSFYKDKSLSDQLDLFISLFIPSPIKIQVGQDLSNFFLSLIFSNFYETPSKDSFRVSLGLFFENPIFPPFFEASGGLFSLWDLLLSETKTEFCDFIFDKISSTIFLYFQTDSTQDAINFLSHVSQSILSLPERNAPNAFQFIYALISSAKPNLLDPFIQFEGFSNINKYIIEKNNPQYLVVYQMFRSMLINGTTEKVVSPILGQVVDFLLIPNISNEIRYSMLTSLFNSIKQINRAESPFQPHQLYTLAISFKDDPQSVVTFFDMCWYISQHFKCDLTAILPSLSKLFVMKTALDYDITSLFRLIFSFGDQFQPFSAMFFEELTKDINEDQLSQFFNKYEFGIELFSQSFSENLSNSTNNSAQSHLFLIFIKCGSNVTNKNLYELALTKIISKPAFIQILIEMFYQLKSEKDILILLFESIIKVASDSVKFRHGLIEVGIVMIIREINDSHSLNPTMIFDLFAVLAGKHFDFSFDAAVSSFLKSVDFLGQDSEAIKKLAFGQKHDEIEQRANLCFPSILHKCDFKIESYFDMWVCGQYAIDNWMKETGKTIDQFPSILDIARRFLLPHHVPLICQHPRLFAEACNDSFGLFPLFEFPKDLTNSQISISLMHEGILGSLGDEDSENSGSYNNSSSISFWFFFREYPASSQMICTFHSISFFATGDDLYANDQFISDFRLNRWYNVVLTVNEKKKAQVYFDSVNKAQLTATFSNSVTFGASQKNASLWFIGGAIRVFHSVIKEDLITEIINKGVSDTVAHVGTLTISPSEFIDIFDGFNQNASKSLAENSRPVLSFPLSSHIHTSYNGNRGLFKMILDYFANERLDDCHYLLNALINLQMNNLSNWDRREFALHISTLINIAPSAFDTTTFEKITNCLSLENETFDWFAFETLILDFGIWNSQLKQNVISFLYGSLAQHKPPKPSMLARFIFYCAHIIENLDKEEISSLFALFERLQISIKTISRLISSLPSFKENISCPSLVYDTSNESPFIFPMLNLLKRSIQPNFTSYFLFHILPPVDSVDLIYQLITMSDYNSLNIDFIMRFCILNCYIFKSWSCALSLLYKMPIDIEQDGKNTVIKPSQINVNVLYYFILMLGIMIPISANLPSTSDWYHLPLKFLNDLIINIDLIPVSLLDNANFKFSLLQLVSFSAFQSTISLFPFAPSISSPDEIVEFATKPSQPFPQSSQGQSCPIPGFDFNISDSNYPHILHSQIKVILPRKLAPNSSVSAKTPLEDYDLNYCTEVLAINSKIEWNDWLEFLQSIRSLFGFDTNEINVERIATSEAFSKIIQFITALVLKVSNDEKQLLSLISHILICGTSLIPQYSITLLQMTLLEILNQFNRKKAFSQSLIQFTCDRIAEGWFSNSILNPFSIMISMCDNCDKQMPDCLVMLTIEMFELIPAKDFPQFINYFINYQHIFFAKSLTSNPNYIICLIERFIPRFSARPKSMKSVMTLFNHSIRKNDELANKWSKQILPNHPDFDFKLLINALMILADQGEESYNDWMNVNVLVNLDLNTLRTDIIDAFEKYYLDSLKDSLSVMSDDRISYSSNFFTNANNLLQVIHSDKVISKSLASTLRMFERDRLLFSVSYFLRLRESMLTTKYHFDEYQSDLLSVSLLADPIYPTKRVDHSPLIYTIPPFPGTKISTVQPPIPEIPNLLPLMPSVILDLITTPIPQFENLSLHTKRQVMLSFSQIVPLSDSFNTALLSLIFEDFNLQTISSVKLLYGVDPIQGILSRTQKCFFFVEGMDINETNQGCHFAYTSTPMILYTFYMSYFINGSFGPCSLFCAHPMIRVPLDALISIQEHYYLQKMTALELNFIYGWNFILIPSIDNYKQFYQLLKRDLEVSLSHFPKLQQMTNQSSLTSITGISFSNTLTYIPSPLTSAYLLSRKDPSKLWTEGLIDNYTYLCILNKLGKRAFCDYTQYCVFPWVISDYKDEDLEDPVPDEDFRDLSLPMGQIGKERAPRFDVIYEDSERQYYYGTHYMHLGVVLYFMFRIDPFCLFSIYLHRGWDHQNRLFYDIGESWNAAAFTSPADVKELIPQFFTLPEFLSNLGKLPLTTTTEGRSVADVILSQWSSSPIDFTHKNLHFLQEDHVTKNLHNWIDLIFGYKSRGEAAIEAKNLFHPLCYAKQRKKDTTGSGVEATTDDGIESSDEIQRDAAITCIINFGQCAYQLYTTPHPSNNKLFNRKHLMTESEHLVSQKLNTVDCPIPVKFPVSDILILEKDVITSTGVSCFTLDYEFSLNLAKLSINATKAKDALQAASTGILNKASSKSLVTGNFLLSTCSISCSKDGVFMALGQREGGVSLYRLHYAANNYNEISDAAFVATFPTAGTVSICRISTLHFLLLAVSKNFINRIDIGTQRLLNPIPIDFKVNCIAIDEYAGLIIAGGYSQIVIWTVSGEEIIRKSIDSSVLSIAIPDLYETVNNRFFMTGHQNGIIRYWQIYYEDKELLLLKNSKVSNRGIQRITINNEANRAVAVTDNDMYCFDFIGSSAHDLKKDYSLECIDCSLPFDKVSSNVRTCSSCHRFYCSRCHPNEQFIKIQTKSQQNKKSMCNYCIKIAKSQANDV